MSYNLGECFHWTSQKKGKKLNDELPVCHMLLNMSTKKIKTNEKQSKKKKKKITHQMQIVSQITKTVDDNHAG